MVCIYCSGDTQVINSRLQRRANQVWRRRHCLKCKSVFTSSEGVDLSKSLSFRTSQNTSVSNKPVTVIEPFQRDILFASILDSCKHREAAVSDATALTGTILGRLRPYMKAAVIDREAVIKVTRETLKRFDKAAAVQYAAYHP
jgi:transcriptional repressor NrdR